MEARIWRIAVLSAMILAATTMSLRGAGFRTRHFVVTAATPEIAKAVAEQAEVYRRDLAIEWLGRELPEWSQPCPITVQTGPHLGAGGATSFMFDRGRPFGWRMSIQGSYQRVMDSVLPHEVTHTIFATHFGQPLPRWADEGACTTVEHQSEKNKQHHNLIRFLQTNRGIAFNKMFAMREYPPDVLPLYAQGYSVTRYLIQQGGKRHFVNYVGEGLKTNNWPAATRKFYGHRDLSELQVKWVAWVAAGSPALPQRGANEAAIAAGNKTQAQPPAGAYANNQLQPVARGQSPEARGPLAAVPQMGSKATDILGRWRSRRQRRGASPETVGKSVEPPGPIDHTYSRQQPPAGPQQRVLDWGNQPADVATRPAPVDGQSYYDRRNMSR